MTADDSVNNDTINQLRSLDRIMISLNPTVRDLLEQAMVAAAVSEDEETYHNIGPLETMYHEVRLLRSQMVSQPSIGGYWQQSNTAVDNTADWYGNPYLNPLRNYPAGHAWDDHTKTVYKTSSGAGT